MEWTKDRQERVITEYMDEAFRQAVFFMAANKDAIKASAKERSLGCGYDQYGDASFQLGEEELMAEKLAEAADLVVYHVIGMAKADQVARGLTSWEESS